MFTGVTSLFPPFPFLVCPRFFFLREFFSCALLFESLEQAKLVHVRTLLCIGQTYLVLVVVLLSKKTKDKEQKQGIYNIRRAIGAKSNISLQI